MESPVPELWRLLNAGTTDSARWYDALIRLFEWLGEPRNRSHANCTAVDAELTRLVDTIEQRGISMADDVMELLMAADCLHDTVSAPHIAETFGGTPEALLARANKRGA